MSNLRIKKKKLMKEQKRQNVILKNVEEVEKKTYKELNIAEQEFNTEEVVNIVDQSFNVEEQEVKSAVQEFNAEEQEIKIAKPEFNEVIPEVIEKQGIEEVIDEEFNEPIVKKVEPKIEPANFEVNINDEMSKQMEELNKMRSLREDNLENYVNQQLKALIQKFDDKYSRLEENIDTITDLKIKNGVNNNLKMAKKMWEKSLKELKEQKQELEKNLNQDRQKIEKDRTKELRTIEKEYLTSQLFTKKDLIMQKYNDELNKKVKEIKEMIVAPTNEYELSKMKLEALNKSFLNAKSNIEEEYDDKLDEAIKNRRGDKSFTEIRVIIPEDKKEELSKIIMEHGYIPEKYMKDFERLSEKDILINDNEKTKSKLINEKYQIFKDESEKLQEVILSNKEILDNAEKVKIDVVNQYNEKVNKLNKNLSEISKENEIKQIEKAKTIKVNQIYTENLNMKTNKAVEFEVEKAPKKENIFTRVANKIKESALYKAFSEKKEAKNKIKLEKEQEERQNELNSLIDSKRELKSLRQNLVSMVKEEPTIDRVNSNTKKYVEIDLMSRG